MQYYTPSTNKLELLLLLTTIPHCSFLALGNDPYDKDVVFVSFLLLPQIAKYYWQKPNCKFKRFIPQSFLSYQCSQVIPVVHLGKQCGSRSTGPAPAFWGPVTGQGSRWHGQKRLLLARGNRGKHPPGGDRHKAQGKSAWQREGKDKKQNKKRKNTSKTKKNKKTPPQTHKLI